MKVHLGCGARYIPGFVHVDILDLPHVDVRGAADDLPFEDESVDLIYSSHLLEHFPRAKTEIVLQEWYRVLKRGGGVKACRA